MNVIFGLIFAFIVIPKIYKAFKKAANENPSSVAGQLNSMIKEQQQNLQQYVSPSTETKSDASHARDHVVNTVPQQQMRMRPQEGQPLNRKTLEGHSMEYRKTTLEGHKVEHQPLRHSQHVDHSKPIVTETSMGKGYAGEGCEVHYESGLSGAAKVTRRIKKSTQSLRFSSNPFVQGIVMAEVLNRKGTRR